VREFPLSGGQLRVPSRRVLSSKERSDCLMLKILANFIYTFVYKYTQDVGCVCRKISLLNSIFCPPAWTRTKDHGGISSALYQLSYRRTKYLIYTSGNRHNFISFTSREQINHASTPTSHLECGGQKTVPRRGFLLFILATPTHLLSCCRCDKAYICTFWYHNVIHYLSKTE